MQSHVFALSTSVVYSLLWLNETQFVPVQLIFRKSENTREKVKQIKENSLWKFAIR